MNPTEDTLALIKEARAGSGELAKSFTQAASAVSGLTAYDLEGPAKTLYPVITPLRNEIPRVSGKGGIQANWRAITGINTGLISPALGEGNRGGVLTTTTKDYYAAYHGLGFDDNVTFEADYAAEGFDDVKARAVEGLLRSLMIAEERIILGGNNTLALGTTPNATVADVTTGGSLSYNTAYGVIVVALTLEGYYASSVANGVTGAITRTNADGSTETYGGGSGAPSTRAAVTTANDSNNTHCVSASVTPVRGAVAYAWYIGTTAGTERLAAITTLNSVVLTALNGSGQLASAAVLSGDNSQNAKVFDGLLTMSMNSTLGGYYASQATGTAGTGTPLTADTEGGVIEIDTALQWFWDNLRLSPSEIWVSSQEQKNITKKVLAGSTSSAQRFMFDVKQGVLAGGTNVVSYLNKFTMQGAQEIPVRLHPNMPAGTILFVTKTLPYPLSNVSNVIQIRTRRDYHQIEWPLRSRKWEYGVYCDEVLQHYFPPSLGVITNIANG